MVAWLRRRRRAPGLAGLGTGRVAMPVEVVASALPGHVVLIVVVMVVVMVVMVVVMVVVVVVVMVVVVVVMLLQTCLYQVRTLRGCRRR